MHAREAGVAIAISVFATSCAVMSGAVMMPNSTQPNGIEFHAMGNVPLDEVGLGGPNVASFSHRQNGADRKTSFALGWMGTLHLDKAMVFGRLMVELLGREELAGEAHTRTLSPTIEFGFVPLGRGVCVSGSASLDVRIGEPDQAVFGVYLGWCALEIR
jgi:hypothetical protein